MAKKAAANVTAAEKPEAALAPSPAPKARKKAAPVAKAPKYFVIAQNRAHAKNDAEHEWNWKPDAGGWIDHTGNRVEFLPEPLASLKKMKGAHVYCGYKWYAAIAPHLFQKLVDDGCAVLVHPPKVS